MRKQSLVYGIIVVLTALALACSGGRTQPAEETSPATTASKAAPTEDPEEPATAISEVPTVAPTQTAEPELSVSGYRQWAVGAFASSEYSDDNWSAYRATGKPDTAECGDYETAWAAATSDTVEWLELVYDVPVRPLQVTIIQTYNPDQVIKVELIDLSSTYHEVYSGQPQASELCPYTLSIQVKDADYQATGVRITIDQSELGLGWNEIDAVELIGEADRPLVPDPASSAIVAWRTSGDLEGEGSMFSELRGLDATSEHVYVADAYSGVHVFDADGAYAGQIGAGEVGNVVDVKVALSGRIYIADAGLQQITMLSREWDLLGGFGSAGPGDGEFGPYSPVALAVHPDGTVFVLDQNENSDGDEILRVLVFDTEGGYQRSFPVEDPSARAMDFGPNANLYISCTSGVILGIDPDDGAVVERLGEDALAGAYPQMLSIDNAGNFYVATQIPAAAMKLDREGRFVEMIGVETVRTEEGWPEGEFLFPVGIAVSPDGQAVYIGDSYEEFSYVTAFGYP